jgi:hypothetical protein
VPGSFAGEITHDKQQQEVHQKYTKWCESNKCLISKDIFRLTVAQFDFYERKMDKIYPWGGIQLYNKYPDFYGEESNRKIL